MVPLNPVAAATIYPHTFTPLDCLGARRGLGNNSGLSRSRLSALRETGRAHSGQRILPRAVRAAKTISANVSPSARAIHRPSSSKRSRISVAGVCGAALKEKAQEEQWSSICMTISSSSRTVQWNGTLATLFATQVPDVLPPPICPRFSSKITPGLDLREVTIREKKSQGQPMSPKLPNRAPNTCKLYKLLLHSL